MIYVNDLFFLKYAASLRFLLRLSMHGTKVNNKHISCLKLHCDIRMSTFLSTACEFFFYILIRRNADFCKNELRFKHLTIFYLNLILLLLMKKVSMNFFLLIYENYSRGLFNLLVLY